jgi:HSP20 family protein
MNVIRYNPWGFVGRHDSNPFFSQRPFSADDDETSTHNDWVPAIDVQEHEDRYLIRADVPGVEAKDLDITTDKGVLILQGSRETRSDEEQNGVRRAERASGRFYRRFNLPDTADSAAIRADYRHGVLEVSIPKQAEAQPQRIQVKVN